jgi:WD40 repeat protein
LISNLGEHDPFVEINLNTTPRTLEFSPNGNQILVGCSDISLKVFNAITGNLDFQIN